MKKQKGLGLIGVLLIIGALVITTGGVLVWQKKIPPAVPLIPTPTPTPTPTLPEAEIPPLQEQVGKTWVFIHCGQCENPPWSKDWRQSHGDNAFYPHSEENKIISKYYQKQGVTIFDIKFVRPEGNVCAGCACPGYTVYLLVSNSDVQKLVDLGYQEKQ